MYIKNPDNTKKLSTILQPSGSATEPNVTSLVKLEFEYLLYEKIPCGMRY